MSDFQDDRCYPNRSDEYKGDTLIRVDGKLKDSLRKPVEDFIEKLLERLYQGIGEEEEENYSVYTGIGGISFLHLHLYSKLKHDKGQLECALDSLRHPLRHLKGHKISFLCGDAGPLAIAAIAYDKLGSKSASQDCVKRLLSLADVVCRDPSLPDELLYGRAGYLYALLLVKHNLGPGSISDEIITKVCRCIIDSGIHMSQQQGWKHPLMYAWHEKHYLGAAHGLAGIFYILMQIKDEGMKKYLEELVQPSVEYMLTLQFPSGNCPSSVGSSGGDKLVHWCHGAPGWIHMFIMAHKVFQEDKYLQAAKKCADVIWTRGLLKKGFGICHGVAGNAYAFLAMYKHTNDQAYLHRSFQFTRWMMQPQFKPRVADHPFSLFEGLAGTIYFLVDLLNPGEAKFPAFDLPDFNP